LPSTRLIFIEFAPPPLIRQYISKMYSLITTTLSKKSGKKFFDSNIFQGKYTLDYEAIKFFFSLNAADFYVFDLSASHNPMMQTQLTRKSPLNVKEIL
jgi:hypothetical protein